MKREIAAAAAMLTLMMAGAPALAGDGWREDRREWREDRRDRKQAYAKGYRDGRRADAWSGRQARGAANWQPYGNVWRQNNGYRYQGANAPLYRGASARGAAPYWWGNDGRVQCRRQDGTTGLLVGAVAGGTLGNIIAGEGDKRLGSVIGGTLGAVLGNELARGNVRCR